MAIKESEIGLNSVNVPPQDGILAVQQKVITCLSLSVVLKQKHEEREQKNREKKVAVESVLDSLLARNLVGQDQTIQKNLECLALSKAEAAVKPISLASLGQTRLQVAHNRLKAMASTRSSKDPTLSEAQYETLGIVRQMIAIKSEAQTMADGLYRGGKDSHNLALEQYEKKAHDYLISTIAGKTRKKDCVGVIAKNICLQELSWLRKEVASTIDIIKSPKSQVETIVQAAYEMRLRQACDPVNPQAIRRQIAEAVSLRKPLRIVIIKCLAHSYKTGKQEITSIYDGESLADKERALLEYILGYQKMLGKLGVPSGIVVAVADTDIPYQREEPLDSQKGVAVQAQINETKLLYQKYGIPVLSLMAEIEKAGLKDRHDKTYLEVKQKSATYIPSTYLERRINKRYQKYKNLEKMTRTRARRVVINSYAEEAALGEIWQEIWGDCIHLVYKTTYLAAAMEASRNPQNEPGKNISTIFSSGQTKRGGDGGEDQ